MASVQRRYFSMRAVRSVTSSSSATSSSKSHSPTQQPGSGAHSILGRLVEAVLLSGRQPALQLLFDLVELGLDLLALGGQRLPGVGERDPCLTEWDPSSSRPDQHRLATPGRCSHPRAAPTLDAWPTTWPRWSTPHARVPSSDARPSSSASTPPWRGGRRTACCSCTAPAGWASPRSCTSSGSAQRPPGAGWCGSTARTSTAHERGSGRRCLRYVPPSVARAPSCSWTATNASRPWTAGSATSWWHRCRRGWWSCWQAATRQNRPGAPTPAGARSSSACR